MKENNVAGNLLPIQVFNYHENSISFRRNDGAIMINATEMAKPFKTRPVQWLRTEQSERYVKALTEVHFCTSTDLQQVVKGGKIQGTWFHEDLAIEFARWLDPKFGIWCNDMVKEIVKNGFARMYGTFNGVPPIIYEGKTYFYYVAILRSLNRSTTSGYVQKRKKNNLKHFVKVYGRNFIDLEFCYKIQDESDGVQLSIDFINKSLI